MKEQPYHHKDLKHTLIKEGIRYINANGEHSLSMRKLAALCHVSHTALYKHFRNKEEFLLAISGYIEEAFTKALQEAVQAANQDVEETIIQVGVAYVRFMAEHPDFMKYHTNTMKAKLYPLKTLETKGVDSYDIFRKAAVAFLQKHACPPETYDHEIFFMWSLVKGLSDMIVYEIVDVKQDSLSLVETIIRKEIQLRCAVGAYR